MFITFDGVDGAGKSTQITRFCEALRSEGHDVVTCRDPGATALGEKVREILLGGAIEMGYRSEMLLYMAARAQLVQEIIRPAVEAGKTVVSDRFLLANVVYQGWAGELEPADIWKVGEVAIGGLHPDHTFLIDLDADLAAARLGDDLDRMESRGIEYLRRVRNGFLTEAAENIDSIHIINAEGSPDDVFARVWSAYQSFS